MLTTLALLRWLALPIAGGEPVILFQEDFEQSLGERWQPVKFEALTDYQVVTENSNGCLQAVANGNAASALVVKVDFESSENLVLSWRWKISGCPTNGTDRQKATFDHAARVFVAFDTLIGPPRTINYVWANQAATNSVFDHPLTARSKFIALQSGNARAGEWLTEERDLAKDWKRLFGSKPMPAIAGIGVFTDSDGTRNPLTGWYDDIVLKPVPPE
jgi:hypothetical protein